MAQLWDRIEPNGKKKGETTAQFQAFHAYLMLPAGERSHAKVAQQLRPNSKVPTTVSIYKRYSRRWKWVDRCAAYDNSIAEHESRLAHRRRIGLLDRRLNFEERLQEAVERRFQEMDDKITKLLALPATDIEELRTDGTVRRVKGVRGLDIAAMQDKLMQAARAAVNGVRIGDTLPGAPASKDKDQAPLGGGTFTFIKPKKKTEKKPRGDFNEQ